MASSAEDVDSDTFGPYQLFFPLGKGGAGEVFACFDPEHHRAIALKVLQDDTSANPKTAQRFESEARLLERLNHPKIVQFFAAGTHDERRYIAMELCN
ncbi:MAG: protein kinase domain-containing protein, partial [Myxococcota bacterium]